MHVFGCGWGRGERVGSKKQDLFLWWHYKLRNVGSNSSNDTNIHYSFTCHTCFFLRCSISRAQKMIYMKKITCLKCLLLTQLRWRYFIILVQEFGGCVENKKGCSLQKNVLLNKNDIEKYNSFVTSLQIEVYLLRSTSSIFH